MATVGDDCKNRYRATLTSIQILASFPDLSHFYLPFAFTIIHGSRIATKSGEGLDSFIT